MSGCHHHRLWNDVYGKGWKKPRAPAFAAPLKLVTRRDIYAWESAVWKVGGVMDSPMLNQHEAQKLSDELWLKHRHLGSPLFRRPPTVAVDPDARYAGLAQYEEHRITMQPWESRLPVILHEAAHLLTPRSGHGPRWRELLLTLWQAELRIEKTVAALAHQQMLTGLST